MHSTGSARKTGRVPSWTDLMRVGGRSPVSELPFRVEAVLSNGLCRVATGMYLFSVSHPRGGRTGNEPKGERYVTLAVWAACDGAALRVFEQQIEADADDCLAPPPDELLPALVSSSLRRSRPDSRPDR